MPKYVQGSENPQSVEERRQDSRIPLPSIAYFYQQDGSCGPIVNISEGGIEVRAEFESQQELRKFYFSLPNCATKIVCDGKVVWTDKEKARVGIQFTEVSENVFEHMRGWITSEAGKLREAETEQPHKPVADHSPDPDFFDFEAFFPPESSLHLESRKKPSPLGMSAGAPKSDMSSYGPDSGEISESGKQGHDLEGFNLSAMNPMQSAVSRQFSSPQRSDHLAEPSNNVASPDFQKATATQSNADAISRSFDALDLQYGSETNISSNQAAFSAAAISEDINPPMGFGRSRISLSPLLTAAIGFGVGLVLCAFVIFGPFDFAKTMNNLLARPDQAPKTLEDTQTGYLGANSVQSPLDIASTAAPAPQALATPSEAAPEQQVRTDRSIRELKGTNGSVTRTDRAISPSSVVPTSAGRTLNAPASQSAAPVALEPQTPLVPVVAAVSQQPDVQKVSGAVTSTSQFVAVHTPQENLSGVLQMGQVTAGPEPVYPAAALQSGTEGTVVLRAVVSSDGSVQKVDAVSGPPELVPAATAAVHNWHYTPTMVADKPVESEYNIILVFRLTR